MGEILLVKRLELSQAKLCIGTEPERQQAEQGLAIVERCLDFLFSINPSLFLAKAKPPQSVKP
jgi:hypothetical protein